MTANERQNPTLQTIFSFFLGLMVLALIGIGVNTFYPSPESRFEPGLRQTRQRQDATNRLAAPGSYTPGQRAELDSLSAEVGRLQDREQAAVKDWARVTSIILLLFSTLVLVVSLLLSEQIRVIANGLLLGGLFSMIYGVGWVIFSGSSMARFWVILAALVIALSLGYLKFVRRRRPSPGEAAAATFGFVAGATIAPAGASARASAGASAGASVETSAEAVRVDAAAWREMEARVAALERRAAAAAAAWSGRETERDSPS